MINRTNLLALMILGSLGTSAHANDAGQTVAEAPGQMMNAAREMSDAYRDQEDGEPEEPDSFMSEMVAIIVPLGSFAFILGLAAIPFYFRLRMQAQKQQTLRAIIEKGGSIPPELIAPPAEAEHGEARDRRRGMILVATGVSSAVFLGVCVGWKAGSFGLIPLSIGAAYLLFVKLQPRDR